MLVRIAKTEVTRMAGETYMIRGWNVGLAVLAGCLAVIPPGISQGEEPRGAPPNIASDWGEVHFTDRGLELHVAEARVPTSGTVRIPRLNNPVAAIYVRGDQERAPLKLTPLVTEWEITMPIGSGRLGQLVVVVETVGLPHLTAKPRVIRPGAKGLFTLAAHDAVIHGQNLRYEPQPHKNTVGYWSRQEDWCEWHLATAKAGRYAVQILQGCGQGQGGSEVTISVGGQELVFTVEETGHFQNFKNRTLGTIELAAGDDDTLQLRPRKMAAGAVMDVRQVRLVPVGPDTNPNLNPPANLNPLPTPARSRARGAGEDENEQEHEDE
jgi:hypothetical protein